MPDLAIVKRHGVKRWPWSRTKWTLCEDLEYAGLIIPTGFVTDGASIPFFIRWFLPSTGDYFEASIIHDFLIHQSVGWDDANDGFLLALKHYEINRPLRYTLYFGVKLNGYLRKVKRLF